MSNPSLIDQWMNKLSNATEIRQEHQEQMLKKLQNLLRDNLVIAKRLEAEAEHLPYPHLKEKALEIVQQKQTNGRKLEDMVSALNGSIDLSDVQQEAIHPDGRFNQVLDLEGGLSENLVEAINWAEDNNFDEFTQLLMEFRDNHGGQIEAIEHLIMKINATL